MSERTGPQQPGHTGADKPSVWRRQARFLGAAFAVAAAVIAVGLRFAPQVTAYAGLSPWVFAGLLGFILVLAGACVLFAASLPATPPAVRPEVQPPPGPPPGAQPWNTADPAVAGSAVAGASAAGPAAPDSAVTPAHPVVPGRGLTILGSVLGVVGLALAALAVVLTVLLPAPTARIEVQFTDLYGRVQLEYCPSLPGSFTATASQADLAGSSTILPVKVSGETCGNPEYTDGVWIYLNRASVTVSDRL
ncbi:hypothetical protein E3T61_08320 [Cryobacterium lactosi]|uniref:Uncharacterized protein n=1 Tax=Cryobacterium lactosi TaxID=1259202 RepID=A0A4R9BVC8_9MICO|nr:hypothetical protein [Cryobacterium lactosi]TFD91698.1 hypothetical protein E3T61_08320 [Cryobacterium lactosi]